MGAPEMSAHFRQAHGMAAAAASAAYHVLSARQCDYCLKPYLNHCTKCNRDFCRFHAGNIGGLCGGCI